MENLPKKTIKNKYKGSLLLNIMVSLGILVFMVTLSLPFIRKYQHNLKLSAVARDLTADLRQAQQMTVTEQIVYRMEMDVLGNEYSLVKTGVATSTIKTIQFPQEVQYQQIIGLTDDMVSFNSYGGVSESGQIVLENINNKIEVITIKPSGYIQLY